ncbi:lactoylglutathione lyase-like [Rosa rugosa]|uniref:lactoylglutathione lyase-like n=1 Tax=Rosa rugosa TaxID=74645 RepID=UPI002B402C28|nr:lactoylglutathione lyase-like [Rosa rugosa]
MRIFVTPELLEWPKKNKRRLLHAVYCVGDLERTTKFYTEALGMKLLRQRDIPEEKYLNAFLGFGPEETNFVMELTYNYEVNSYDIGIAFGYRRAWRKDNKRVGKGLGKFPVTAMEEEKERDKVRER